MPKPKKVQLKDIAEAANVSTALVSYVLNGRHQNRIKKETAERIKATARSLNYRPNHFGQGLRTQKSNTIGLILADLANPFSAQLARIIENELNQHGYIVLIGSMDERNAKLKELIDTFARRQVDGLIVLPAENSEQEIARLHNMDIPYVLMDRYFPNTAYNFVVNDNYFTTYTAVKHLVEKGRKKIGFITFETSLFHIYERKRGFTAACAEAGISTDTVKEVHLDRPDKEVAKALDELRQEHADLDAVLFSTNMLTLYGLKYAIQHQLNIPTDIDIVAVDEAQFYDIFPTPITYYQQPLKKMGQQAIRFLMKEIEGNNTYTIQEVIRGELIIRS